MLWRTQHPASLQLLATSSARLDQLTPHLSFRRADKHLVLYVARLTRWQMGCTPANDLDGPVISSIQQEFVCTCLLSSRNTATAHHSCPSNYPDFGILPKINLAPKPSPPTLNNSHRPTETDSLLLFEALVLELKMRNRIQLLIRSFSLYEQD